MLGSLWSVYRVYRILCWSRLCKSWNTIPSQVIPQAQKWCDLTTVHLHGLHLQHIYTHFHLKETVLTATDLNSDFSYWTPSVFTPQFQFTEEAVLSINSAIPLVVLSHRGFPERPSADQRKTKQTDSGKENTGLRLNFCFQGRAIPVALTCQRTHSMGFERQSVTSDSINASELWGDTTYSHVTNCCNQSCCRVLL